MIFYFSATGNSKYVATRLAQATGDTIISMTDCLRENRFDFAPGPQEAIGFVTPVYFWGLPSPVVAFMERLKIDTNEKHYAYGVLTYGTMTGQATKMLNRYMPLDGKFTVQMVDTWTPMFDLTDEENNKRINEKAEPEIDGVAKQINGQVSGDFDKRKVPLAGIYYRTYPIQSKTKRLTVDDTCIGCGLCARQCPVSAIEMKNGRPVWVKDHCAICLGCLHRCPTFSIQYGKRTRTHGQYVNPNVKL